MLVMRNIKEVILANQENQDFMTRVDNSQTIENLYSVLCEYGYSSDMKEFEQDVYEILKNSDLVTNSVSDGELEKVSGGVNMRQKIMSIVTLTGLTVGGVQNFVGAKPQNKLRSEQRKQHKITKGLPTKEKIGLGIGIPSTLGVVTLLSIFAPKGIKYIKKQEFSNKETTATNPEMANTNNLIEFEKPQNLKNETEEMSYDGALDIIKEFHKTDQQNLEEFPVQVIAAVRLIEQTFFNGHKPHTYKQLHREDTNLRLFPNKATDCLEPTYFKPISWDNGNGNFVKDDSWMLHKALFQYLCRLLSFLLVDHTPPEGWKKDHGYVYYLRGHDRWEGPEDIPNYQPLFSAIEDNLEVKEQFTDKKEKVKTLVGTLRAMYNIALSNKIREAKCGVFCGSGRRLIDN